MGAQCTATAAAKAVGRSSCGGGNRPEPAWILGFKPKRTNLHEKYDYPEGKIAKWQIPDDVVFLDAIPLGATGKMLKVKLREMLKDKGAQLQA